MGGRKDLSYVSASRGRLGTPVEPRKQAVRRILKDSGQEPGGRVVGVVVSVAGGRRGE